MSVWFNEISGVIAIGWEGKIIINPFADCWIHVSDFGEDNWILIGDFD